jgi:hypothetical protein
MFDSLAPGQYRKQTFAQPREPMPKRTTCVEGIL